MLRKDERNFFSLVNTKLKTTEEMILKIPSLKRKTKRKLHQNLSVFYDQMNYLRQSNMFHFEENPYSKNAQSIGTILHEALLLRKFFRQSLGLKRNI